MPGSYPSILELAYIVNLEYYMNDMSYRRFTDIQEPSYWFSEAKVPVKEMVEYLQSRKWQIGTRTHLKGFWHSTFLNHPSKQVVIVHRGTEIPNWYQLQTDINIALDNVSREEIEKIDWHTCQSLLNNALKQENGKFVRNDYTVTITGHSLGGWISQISTLIYKNPKFHPSGPRGVISFGNGMSLDMNQPYDLHCVAFDSPGANELLKHMNLVAKNSFAKDVENSLKNLDITVYLSNENLVNKCGTQVGKVKRMDVMSDASFFERMKPLASHSMERIVCFFKKNPNF